DAGAACSGDHVYVTRLVDGHARVSVYGLDGTPRGDVALPGLGAATVLRGPRAQRAAYYEFSSFTTPRTAFAFDPATGRSTPFHPRKAAIDPADYVVEEVFVTSMDGARVPMFVAHRKGMTPDGSHPAMLTGYGGFGLSYGPRFTPEFAWWLSRGGVLAIP